MIVNRVDDKILYSSHNLLYQKLQDTRPYNCSAIYLYVIITKSDDLRNTILNMPLFIPNIQLSDKNLAIFALRLV
jgi:hypothetical protein